MGPCPLGLLSPLNHQFLVVQPVLSMEIKFPISYQLALHLCFEARYLHFVIVKVVYLPRIPNDHMHKENHRRLSPEPSSSAC